MATLEIKQCILTNNDCYKQGKKIIPKGIVVHSTGADNSNLKRYVQPDDGILGDNPYNNDWNRSGVSKCVHAFIGKDKNGKVRIYQTLPWDYRCWGCGSGKKGSYNDSHIQFEIAEDALMDEKYFNEAFALAIELCAYLSKKYNIPINNIVSHKEAHKSGYASNHTDCDHWLEKFKKNMKWFRNEVSTALKPKPVATPKYVGYLDNATESTINGWAWNSIDDTALKVDIQISNGSKVVKTISTTANIYRSDLENAKKGNGKHGFSVSFDFKTLGTGTYTVKAYTNGKALIGTKTVKVVVKKVTTSTNSTVSTSQYYPKYTGKSIGLDTILKAIGVPSKHVGNWKARVPLAEAQGIKNYKGSILQNSKLKSLAKNGKLKKI